MSSAARSVSQRLSSAEAAVVYDGFIRVLEAAARDDFIGERLALADTTVEVHFADTEPELSFTMLCDRTPIEIVEGGHADAEIHLFGSMADCARFMAGDLHLAMAIARGQVSYTGPVRKVLRAVPILRRLFGEQAMRLIEGENGVLLGPLLQRLLAPPPGAARPDAGSGDGLDTPASELLDKAADYEREYGDLWRGALEFDESEPGEFWSIRIEPLMAGAFAAAMNSSPSPIKSSGTPRRASSQAESCSRCSTSHVMNVSRDTRSSPTWRQRSRAVRSPKPTNSEHPTRRNDRNRVVSVSNCPVGSRLPAFVETNDWAPVPDPVLK